MTPSMWRYNETQMEALYLSIYIYIMYMFTADAAKGTTGISAKMTSYHRHHITEAAADDACTDRKVFRHKVT